MHNNIIINNHILSYMFNIIIWSTNLLQIQEPVSDFSSHLDDTKQRPILPSLVNECSITEDNQSYPKPIAFNVPFEEDKDTMEIKGRPKRLKVILARFGLHRNFNW